MTASEALQILDNVASSVQLTRAEHVKIQEATEVLKNLIMNESKEAE